MQSIKNNSLLACENDNCLIKISRFGKEFDHTSCISPTEHFRARQEVFVENNSVKGFYFILEGVVKIFKENNDKDQIVRLSTRGDILGHRGIGREVYPVSAVALTDTKLCFIERSRFDELLDNSASFSKNLMLFFADELNIEETKLSELANFSVIQKGKKALEIMFDSLGVSNDNYINHSELLTRQEIGDLVGLTANQTTKVLKELQEDKLIGLDGKRISIENIHALR